MQVSNILESIERGAIALPEFQRGYVWSRKQVRNFMLSMYRKYPVGSLLVWETPTETAPARGDANLQAGYVKLLLDGQQRVTTLYGVIRGRAPEFFDGNSDAFLDLMFHLDNEVFEFYGPVKMRDNPFWINVTELMQGGLGPHISRIHNTPELQENAEDYLARLNDVAQIKEHRFHIEEVSSETRSLDTVVDIFNKVNSGGTKLSKGDLALAKVCAGWPEAREEMRAMLDRWKAAGFYFKLDWLLRNVTTVLTGQAFFSGLEQVSPSAFRDGLYQTEKAINYTLNMISGRLGLDHDRVLGGRYAIPVITRYIIKQGGRLQDAAERDKLLYWYIHTFLWGRYTGSTESVLNQDLRVIEEAPDGQALNRLIDQLRIWRGDLIIRPENFQTWSKGARFYPLLYLLTRIGQSQDWGTGLPLKESLLGKINQLQVHHIFPKSLLYDLEHTRVNVNALANFCFLTQDTNLVISNRKPEEYFLEVQNAHPGALESQWIPMQRRYWRLKNYLQFLEEREKLLAQAANDFLGSLLSTEPDTIEDYETIVIEREPTAVVGGIASDEEEQILREINDWVIRIGLAEGEIGYELLDEDEEGHVLAIVDLAWPEGVQEGLSDPVAILINEGSDIEDVLNREGFRYFTSIDEFKSYVNEEILAIEPVAGGD